MKKKTVAILTTGVLIMGLVPAALFASGQGVGRQFVNQGACAHRGLQYEQYANNNRNAMRDNYGTHCSGCVDENSDGICDNYAVQGGGNGQGVDFVDKNDDGICDNRSSQGGGNGQGHHGMGHGCA